MIASVVIGIVASALAFGQAALAQAQLIVPGKSVGAITLGMTQAEVHRRLGNPTQSWMFSHNAEAYGEDVWCQKQKDRLDYFTVITSREGVVQVEATDPRLRTIKGFSVSDDFSRYRRLYPHAWVEQHLFNPPPPDVRLLGYGQPSCVGYYIDDVQQGFAVTLRSQCDKVDYELPFLNPDSVVVHKTGTHVLPILVGRWASVEPRSTDDYLDQMKAWFAGGVYRPRTAQQILMMQKKAEAGRSR